MSYWWFLPSPPVVEETTPSDHAVLAEIHERSFPSGWSEDDLAALARQPGVTILQARRSSLLGSRSILGFVILRVAADEAEVLTIAVDPRQRQRGVGALLMRHALSRLYADRIASLFLEVDAANAPALALYRRLGFRKVGERRGYYRDSAGDGGALVMRVDLA